MSRRPSRWSRSGRKRLRLADGDPMAIELLHVRVVARSRDSRGATSRSTPSIQHGPRPPVRAGPRRELPHHLRALQGQQDRAGRAWNRNDAASPAGALPFTRACRKGPAAYPPQSPAPVPSSCGGAGCARRACMTSTGPTARRSPYLGRVMGGGPPSTTVVHAAASGGTSTRGSASVGLPGPTRRCCRRCAPSRTTWTSATRRSTAGVGRCACTGAGSWTTRPTRPVRALIDAVADFGLPQVRRPQRPGAARRVRVAVQPGGRATPDGGRRLPRPRARPAQPDHHGRHDGDPPRPGRAARDGRRAGRPGRARDDRGRSRGRVGRRVQSPQLLLHSGIGPAEPIEAVGLKVTHRLDGVGENFQDHAVIYMTFQGTTELREDYLIPKVRLIAKSSADLTYGDLHVFMQPSIRVPGIAPLLPVSVRLLDDRSRGRLARRPPTRRAAGGRTGHPARPSGRGAMLDAMRFVTRLPPIPAWPSSTATSSRRRRPTAGTSSGLHLDHLQPRRRDVPHGPPATRWPWWTRSCACRASTTCGSPTLDPAGDPARHDEPRGVPGRVRWPPRRWPAARRPSEGQGSPARGDRARRRASPPGPRRRSRRGPPPGRGGRRSRAGHELAELARIDAGRRAMLGQGPQAGALEGPVGQFAQRVDEDRLDRLGPGQPNSSTRSARDRNAMSTPAR